VLAQHPVKDRFDAFWVVQGRLVDWGPLPGATELAERTEAALARSPGRTVIPVEEVDELRIVAGWIADHEPPALELEPAPSVPDLLRFVAAATPGGPAPALPRSSDSRASVPATSS
jgi:hypothetical protein